MALSTGTYDISDLLAVANTSATQFGMDTIAAVLQADVAAHNALVNDMLGDLVETSSDRLRLFGTSVGGEMVKIDEYGRPPTQKQTPGVTVGFPLEKYGWATGWTRDFRKVATPADYAVKVAAAEGAHLTALRREIQRALYLATDYTFEDYMVDKLPLAVKRLTNADGDPIPNGPNGATFTAGSHTHYNARAGTLAASDVDALVTDVLEHGHGGQIKIVISTTNTSAISGLSGFTPNFGPHFIPGSATNTTGTTLDVTRADNRMIGYWNGAYEVWTKPWAIANYYLAYDARGARKPLVMRQRDQPALQGLRIAAEIDLYPLHAEYLEAEFGFGVWNRTNGAILYTGGTSWTDPTIS